MLNKEEIAKAFEILENLDSFWDNSKEEIFNAVKVLMRYVDYLENRLESKEKVHEYDFKMIDEVKGENVKLNKMIDEMAKKIYEEGIVWENEEDVKRYFEKKVGKLDGNRSKK